MSAENTKGKIEFIIDHVWWAFVAWIWYKGILFRCLGLHSLKESRLILLGFVLVCSLTGILLEMRKQCNSISVLMNLLAGFELYTVFAYLPIRRKLILITILMAAVLAVIYSALILCVRRHIMGDANRTFIPVLWPPRLCRIGIHRSLLAGRPPIIVAWFEE